MYIVHVLLSAPVDERASAAELEYRHQLSPGVVVHVLLLHQLHPSQQRRRGERPRLGSLAAHNAAAFECCPTLLLLRAVAHREKIYLWKNLLRSVWLKL